MPEIKVGDNILYCDTEGTGPPLVMIRGLGSNADHWYAQVPAFAREFQVVTFDNRGVARSSDPGGDFTISMMVEDTIGVMDALGIERAHILGLSMGGMIAQEIAINHPERVMGLVLVATHCGGAQYVKASKEVELIFKEMIYVASEESKIKASAALFDSETLKKHAEIVQEYAKISLEYPASALILTKQWEAVSQHDTYDRLERIGAPTLVLTGASDVLVPPENSRILAAKIPDSELTIIPGGGHQVLVEQPDLSNNAILRFLRQLNE